MRKYDRLSEQIDLLRMAVERLTGHIEAINVRDVVTDRNMTDYETRLRGLERWRYALPTSVILGLGSAVIALLSVVH